MGEITVYELGNFSSDLRLCLLADIVLRGICRISDQTVSSDNLVICQHFTEYLCSELFGSEVPITPFKFLFLLCHGDGISWDAMRECYEFEGGSPLKIIPNPPFIVQQSFSRKLYRVDSVITCSARELTIPVDVWGSNKQSQFMTLADFYKRKYGVEVSSGNIVLVARLGCPFAVRSLTPQIAGRDEPVPKPQKATSKVHLLPEFVSLHPISEWQSAVSYLPRFLFHIDSGLLVQRIYHELIVEASNPFSQYQTYFLETIPEECRFVSPVFSLLYLALTCPSANLGFSYEKLEWLGDAVWRYTICRLSQTEDRVKRLYDKMMSNEYLSSKISQNLPYIHTSSVLSSKPNLAKPLLARSRLRNFNILADITEALIAVSFMAGGMPSVFQTARKIGLLEYGSIEDTSSSTSSRSFPAVKSRLGASLSLLTRENASLKLGQLNEKRKSLLGMEFPDVNSALEVS